MKNLKSQMKNFKSQITGSRKSASITKTDSVGVGRIVITPMAMPNSDHLDPPCVRPSESPNGTSCNRVRRHEPFSLRSRRPRNPNQSSNWPSNPSHSISANTSIPANGSHRQQPWIHNRKRTSQSRPMQELTHGQHSVSQGRQFRHHQDSTMPPHQRRRYRRRSPSPLPARIYHPTPLREPLPPQVLRRRHRLGARRIAQTRPFA